MSNIIPFKQKFNVSDLFLNMHRTQHELNKSFKNSIFYLKEQNEKLKLRYELLKSILIALILFTIASVVACCWAIHDFKTKPVTVLIDNQVQELDKIPLPPLEELKEL